MFRTEKCHHIQTGPFHQKSGRNPFPIDSGMVRDKTDMLPGQKLKIRILKNVDAVERGIVRTGISGDFRNVAHRIGSFCVTVNRIAKRVNGDRADCIGSAVHGVVSTLRMKPISQNNHEQIIVRVDPERSSGESGVAEGGGRIVPRTGGGACTAPFLPSETMDAAGDPPRSGP